jgi:hypothetical protein
MASPFRQKFMEIERRQGGDVAPPSSLPPSGFFIRVRAESRSRDAIDVLTSAFTRNGKSMKRRVPYAIHKVSGINSDLRGSDRCLFDILA